MSNASYDLRLAGQGIGAINIDPAPLDMRPAARTDRRQFRRLFRFIPFDGAENFRNNVIRPSDKHTGAYADPLPLNIIPVIERSPFDGRSREFDRLKMSKGRKFSRSADLPGYITDYGRRLLRREFICYRPSRKTIGKAERFAGSEITDLYNHPVD
ncbi:MAG: hypothetical protein BWY11_00691 [Firmicutes bacterium ADurb.Bin182]|nr:MAG: hypothetical protein BWY11_00691 [Firmicutes bacterium ADurb.Bin182]